MMNNTMVVPEEQAIFPPMSEEVVVMKDTGEFEKSTFFRVAKKGKPKRRKSKNQPPAQIGNLFDLKTNHDLAFFAAKHLASKSKPQPCFLTLANQRKRGTGMAMSSKEEIHPMEEAETPPPPVRMSAYKLQQVELAAAIEAAKNETEPEDGGRRQTRRRSLSSTIATKTLPQTIPNSQVSPEHEKGTPLKAASSSMKKQKEISEKKRLSLSKEKKKGAEMNEYACGEDSPCACVGNYILAARIRKNLTATRKENMAAIKSLRNTPQPAIPLPDLGETDEQACTEGVSLQEMLRQSHDNIETLRHRNVSTAERLTDQEAEIVRQRVAQQEAMRAAFEARDRRKKLTEILTVHPRCTVEEAREALVQNQNREDLAVVALANAEQYHEIRKAIAERAPKRARVRMRRSAPANRRTTASMSEAEKAAASSYERRRLPLDQALQDSDNFDGWSPARIRAFQAISTNPNSYYYRFNAPGEAQRTGAWEQYEVDLFWKRLREFGANKQWGIFSMAIPGRVGYQCSNYYRRLIEMGEVVDDNYVLDEKGKARWRTRASTSQCGAVRPTGNGGEAVHFVPVRAPVVKKKPPKVVAKRKAKTPKVAKPRKKARRKGSKRRKRSADVVYAEDIDDEEILEEERAHESGLTNSGSNSNHNHVRSSSRNASSTPSKEEENHASQQLRLSNPLPGVMDAITMEEVVRPAISPYGHVLSKLTWHRCLNRDPPNICPFTKNELKPRQLVLLTHENIGEYKDKMIGITYVRGFKPSS